MLIKVYKKFKEIYETYVKIFKVKNWKIQQYHQLFVFISNHFKVIQPNLSSIAIHLLHTLHHIQHFIPKFTHLVKDRKTT